MAVQVSYPGVYIDEFAPGAPIEGVGTSTAAFLGLSKYGPPNRPTRITSWEAFLREFWKPDEKPDDTHYLWYAVRGFFENAGRDCVVVAVSNASPDTLTLRDSGAAPASTITITARTAGAGSGISVKAEPQSAVANGKVFRGIADVVRASGNVIEFATEADAAPFLAGDVIRIKKSTTSESAVVARAEGKLVRLQSALQNAYTGANIGVRLDDVAAGATAFRAENVEKLSPGSVVEITQTGATTVIGRVTSIAAQRISAALTTYRVAVDQDISGFDMLATDPIKIVSHEFKLTVRRGGVDTPYPELAMDPGHPRFFAAIVNNDVTGLVVAAAVEPPNTTPLPANRPSTGGAFLNAAGGADGNPATISAFDFENALRLLEPIDDINLVAAPGRDDQAMQVALIGHCEKLQDRFALLATPRGTPLFGAGAAEDAGLRAPSARGYAALYYPWLLVTSVKSGERLPVPPTGHVAGIIARTDNRRGVFKAPAGIEATVSGALGVVTPMSDDEQGLLNMRRVNVIRVFQAGGRPVVWGARTTADDRNWQYVNIRRLFLFLEESIQDGIRWAVFEPNIPPLWQKLKRSLTAFLTQQWRDGALFGNTAQEAFYVRIDDVLNPDTERALGRLYIEIGVRPAYPAEFIVVRIGIWQGGGDVSES